MRVGVAEACLCQVRTGGLLARTLQHWRGDVDAEHRTVGAEAAGDFERGLAAATADVEHVVSRGDSCGVDGGDPEFADLRVEEVL